MSVTTYSVIAQTFAFNSAVGHFYITAKSFPNQALLSPPPRFFCALDILNPIFLQCFLCTRYKCCVYVSGMRRRGSGFTAPVLN